MLEHQRTTVYLESKIHRALKLRSAETGIPISSFVNDVLRQALFEDLDDLEAIKKRQHEPTRPFEEFLRELKRDGYL